MKRTPNLANKQYEKHVDIVRISETGKRRITIYTEITKKNTEPQSSEFLHSNTSSYITKSHNNIHTKKRTQIIKINHL